MNPETQSMTGEQTGSHPCVISHFYSRCQSDAFDNQSLRGTCGSSIFSPVPFAARNVGSTSVPSPPFLKVIQLRKRGCPKGNACLPKPVVYGPQPCLGRPPGSGYKQKQAVLDTGPLEVVKRPRGRPKKVVLPPGVSIEFGRVVSQSFYDH